MPFSASDIESASYLRLLVLGGPKSGKTTCTVTTSPRPVYVINADDEHALLPAARSYKEFSWDPVYAPNGDVGKLLALNEKAIVEARRGVAAGEYKTIVYDTFTYFAQRLEEGLLVSYNNDGRRTYPDYERKLRGTLDRLFALKAHVIVNCHYLDVKGALIGEQLEKSGDGICPLLAGKARATIPAMFGDVIFLEVSGGKRVFRTSAAGVFGPGCRNLDGVDTVEANIDTLWEMMRSKHSPVITSNQHTITKKPKGNAK